MTAFPLCYKMNGQVQNCFGFVWLVLVVECQFRRQRRIFLYKELSLATNGFSEDKKHGEGGFGRVYSRKTYDALQVIKS